MNALIKHLLDHLILDFDGELSMETVRNFLRSDESRDARAVLSKLADDRGTENMMLTLADCLKEYLRSGINEDVLREQLRLYAES